MKSKCFNEGTMQAFLDGELTSDLVQDVARHIAQCEPCALLLKETEEESDFAFTALDEEFNSLVPTERIRTNLYRAISRIDQPKRSFRAMLFGGLAMLSNPSVAAFALLMIVFLIGLGSLILRNQNPPLGDLSKSTAVKEAAKPLVSQTPADDPVTDLALPVETARTQFGETRQSVQKAVYRLPNADSQVDRPSFNKKGVVPIPAEAISGELTYIKTIDELTKTVNSQKDRVLRPSARISFEKDLAIVDDSIVKMKEEVRKDPRNEAAKQILRSSYQNKIDLLNSVNEKSELMAILR